MNKLLAASLLALTTLSGCLGCSAFSGGDDRVLSRQSDSIILCENNGFVASVNGGVVEGKYQTDATGSEVATRGDDGSIAFVLTWGADNTASTTVIGDGAWTELDMNQTELDHADIQCKDLLDRSWWSAE